MQKTGTKSIVLIGLFSALTAAGAFIRLPMWPVSITLQFFITICAGLMLGARKAAASQLIYLLVGLAGVPVFSEGGGIGYIAKPSFGFLVGLIPAAYVVGIVGRKRRDIAGMICAGAAGLAVLYLAGLPYMYFSVNVIMKARMPVWAAISSGMLVFLPGDILKIVAAAIVSLQTLKRAGNIFGSSLD